MANTPSQFSRVEPLPEGLNTEYEEFLQYRRQQQFTESHTADMALGLYADPPHPPSEDSGRSAIPQIVIDDLLAQPGRDKLPRLDPDMSEGSTWFKYDKRITKTILKLIRDINQPYVSYESLPEPVKIGWFRAFAQEFNWDSGITSLVRTGFDEQAKNSFTNNMHEWKKKWLANKGKPKWMSDRVWGGYLEYWTLERTKEIAQKNTQNRRSDRGGDGIAIHNNGAKTFQRRKQELTESNGGVEPSMLQLLEDTHTCKKSGQIKDKKVKRIVDTIQEQVNEIITQRSSTCEGGSSQSSNISVSEINRLVIQATPKYKGRRLGFGTLPDPCEGTSRRTAAQDAELARLQQLTEQQNEIISSLQASHEEMKTDMKKMQFFMRSFYDKFPDAEPSRANPDDEDDDTQC